MEKITISGEKTIAINPTNNIVLPDDFKIEIKEISYFKIEKNG